MRTFIIGTVLGFIFGGTFLDFFIAFAVVGATFTFLDTLAYGIGAAWRDALNQ